MILRSKRENIVAEEIFLAPIDGDAVQDVV
jgi:hypothetical protein